MPKSLPSAWQFVRDAWQLFLKTWDDSIKVSIWFLYFGLVYFAVYVSIALLPQLLYLALAVTLGVLVFWSWTIIRLIETSFRLDEGKKPDVSKKAMKASWMLVLPLFWVGLLQLLVIVASAIPLILWQFFFPHWVSIASWAAELVAFILLMPVFYVIVRLSFSQLIAIEHGARGIHALAASSEMTRGRCWTIFQRQFIGFAAFGLLFWLAASILLFTLGLIVGPEKFIALSASGSTDPLLKATIAVIEGMLQATLMPFLFLFTVKLYKSIKNA